NANAILDMLSRNPLEVINRVVEISTAGRAPNNDPALFVLAMAMSSDSLETKNAARAALPKVARIGTDLFHFAEFVEGFRGWGRGLRGTIADWYESKSIESLALQLVKYQSRDGWSHRDLLKLCHSKMNGDNMARHAAIRWAIGGMDEVSSTVRRKKTKSGYVDVERQDLTDYLPDLIEGFEKAKRASSAKEIVQLIRKYDLPREAIPTEFLNDVSVWEVLLYNGSENKNTVMPMGAMIRNLAKMTSIGLLGPLSEASKVVCEKLTDAGSIKSSRIHPIKILDALKVYGSGRGVRGSLTWNPVSRIVDALDEAFYMAFDNVEPTGKSHLLAVDVSGSMSWGNCVGSNVLTPREASAAMALLTAKTERDYHIMGFSHKLVDVPITPKMRLDQAVRTLERIPMGGTDCSLPMIHACQAKMSVDVFCVYTDNETWAGRVHPTEALSRYRKEHNESAKMAVFGMTATEFSIADPSDAGSMDFVGFDTNAPVILADFVRN
ncbi:MAG: TROVE domain-containing protein, partial [Candidimonas sp.]